MTPVEIRTSLANLRLERDAIALYDELARIEKDPRRVTAFRTIAANERRHADIWSERLRDAGANVPPSGPPRVRVRAIILLARLLGTRAVADLVRALEGDEEEAYADQLGPEVASIAADEREHAEIWRRLDAGVHPASDGHAAGVPPADDHAIHAAVPSSAQTVGGRDETWHRAGRSGTLRATIFGVNDGLVSNMSLVMGVTGANAENSVIVLAGVAGLVAGAFSMAAGEWISMQSQRELFERQIALEREEMRIMPDVEQAELAGIFQRKGLPAEHASHMASHLMGDQGAALDTKVREELGLDPDELGSPWGAATGSFLSFAGGASVPLVPFLLASGDVATLVALAASFLALFVVGAGVSLLTGRGTLFSGLRQVLIGAAAAGVTYLVGRVIGVTVAG